jgi:hypothetical protein
MNRSSVVQINVGRVLGKCSAEQEPSQKRLEKDWKSTAFTQNSVIDAAY